MGIVSVCPSITISFVVFFTMEATERSKGFASSLITTVPESKRMESPREMRTPLLSLETVTPVVAGKPSSSALTSFSSS